MLSHALLLTLRTMHIILELFEGVEAELLEGAGKIFHWSYEYINSLQILRADYQLHERAQSKEACLNLIHYPDGFLVPTLTLYKDIVNLLTVDPLRLIKAVLVKF